MILSSITLCSSFDVISVKAYRNSSQNLYSYAKQKFITFDAKVSADFLSRNWEFSKQLHSIINYSKIVIKFSQMRQKGKEKWNLGKSLDCSDFWSMIIVKKCIHSLFGSQSSNLFSSVDREIERHSIIITNESALVSALVSYCKT